MASAPYAGDVQPTEAWDVLQSDDASVLVDVRTQPEWAFVGVPDLSATGKQPLLVQWHVFPTMQPNPQFTQQLESAGISQGQKVYFICRSGVRSQSAAIAATEAGLGPCFNVAGGFEGVHDDTRHRGATTGWKSDGLPWIQD